MTEKKEHPCPICGKMTKNKFCSRTCYWDNLKTKSQKSTSDLGAYDNVNRCFKCKKPMPFNRYSAYCEECEMHLEWGEDD